MTSIQCSKDLLENMFAKTTVAPVQKNLLSVAALMDIGHGVTVKKEINSVCGIQGQDGNASAESAERTRWASHWSRWM